MPEKLVIQSLTPTQELALAIKLAADGHLNQKDKGGSPYILHPIKVMYYLKTDDMQLMAIGVMHDLLEDTEMVAADLVLLGFSQRVINGVVRLTKADNQTPEEYLLGILESYDAIRVKLCDLRHNTDVRRLKGIGHKDLLRIQKYHDMYVRLKQAEGLHESLNNLSRVVS